MFYNTRLFMACHRFSYSVTFRHGFWFSELCKRLVLCFTLHVLHILLCLCSQLCYRFSVYITVLCISHVSCCKSNLRFGILLQKLRFRFTSIYVLEYLLSHPYDLLRMFYDFRNSFVRIGEDGNQQQSSISRSLMFSHRG